MSLWQDAAADATADADDMDAVDDDLLAGELID
jgi:hypothetical protein